MANDETIEDVAKDLINHWFNGNLDFVLQKIVEMPAMKSAHLVALMVCDFHTYSDPSANVRISTFIAGLERNS